MTATHIKTIRRSRGLSQDAFGVGCGASQKEVSLYENGRVDYRRSFIESAVDPRLPVTLQERDAYQLSVHGSRGIRAALLEIGFHREVKENGAIRLKEAVPRRSWFATARKQAKSFLESGDWESACPYVSIMEHVAYESEDPVRLAWSRLYTGIIARDARRDREFAGRCWKEAEHLSASGSEVHNKASVNLLDLKITECELEWLRSGSVSDDALAGIRKRMDEYLGRKVIPASRAWAFFLDSRLLRLEGKTDRAFVRGEQSLTEHIRLGIEGQVQYIAAWLAFFSRNESSLKKIASKVKRTDRETYALAYFFIGVLTRSRKALDRARKERKHCPEVAERVAAFASSLAEPSSAPRRRSRSSARVWAAGALAATGLLLAGSAADARCHPGPGTYLTPTLLIDDRCHPARVSIVEEDPGIGDVPVIRHRPGPDTDVAVILSPDSRCHPVQVQLVIGRPGPLADRTFPFA